MITIRCYRSTDAEEAGRLIAETYSESFAPGELRKLMLGPFYCAGHGLPIQPVKKARHSGFSSEKKHGMNWS
jgi:hypothetical protein